MFSGDEVNLYHDFLHQTETFLYQLVRREKKLEYLDLVIPSDINERIEMVN